ncbi:MAG: TonB-dependent receptor [Chitinophagaceae bacterium]|nr:TonB-dependent receptor [Chitinophagaceae bacterium]
MLPTKHLIIICLLLISSAVFAQRQTISGKVIDSRSEMALQGVTVVVKSTKAGTITNEAGEFSVQALPTDVLEITMVGYVSQTVGINGQTRLTIRLQSTTDELTEIVLVGSRRGGRMKTETPVPVDVVNIGQVSNTTSRMDITSILNYAAPSFNFNKQSGSDGADHIDLATLRGLGPDQTLVLVNGKRRHQTSFIAVFGTRGRGNSGTDLSALPLSAIDRVEILRDGASAQYGSDAIAGVINLVLKKNTGVFTGNVGFGTHYDRKYNPHFEKDYDQYIYHGAFDGNAITFNGNYGVKIGDKGGFINFSANLLSQAKTFRQALDTAANSSDFMYTNVYRRAHGDGSVKNGGAFVNMEVPLQGSTNFYAFGGYNFKKTDAFAFTRNWSARPDRFPTDNNGNMIFVPDIMVPTGDADTFFNPHIQTKISDISVAAGIKGKSAGGWNWDISNSLGRNNFHFYGDKTFNASLGSAQTHFDDGGFNFLQNTVNAIFSKELTSSFNLAVGAEYRYERYELFAGEEASYKNYDATGEKATGAQGFPGFQPGDEVTDNRSVVGVFADAEYDVTSRFLLNGAVRFENYSDFGSTFNMKLASRLKVANNFNLRGSISTGFRAPSLQQINFSSTFTTVQGGTIAEVKIAPNYSPITRAAGIDELKQEKSLNASLGFAWNPISDLSVTIDGYLVKIKDRVVLSGQFSADDPTLDPALTSAMLQLDVALAQFFANAVNTTNRGIDIIIDYNKRLGNGNNFRGLFTANFQSMDIDKINVPAKLSGSQELRATFLTEREQAFILASAPKSKFAINLEYSVGKVTVGTRLTHFGKVVILGYGDGTDTDFSPPFSRGDLYAFVPADSDSRPVKDQFNYSGKLVTDLYFNFKVNRNLSLALGADNLFNVHPDLGINPDARGWAFNNETGGPWDAVQMGGNGMRLFVRVGVTF